ncbi:MAG: sugar phosphate isomerase/epimerase [Ardenticatenaceae bacterium]|nr:sugar phosphate isomerase/epimerase [Ardenticatenaceae bacterium]HBY98215.1 hypothetical protein [Chloroflexota bacterium]
MRIGCAALYPITRYGFPYSFDNYLLALREMREAGFHWVEMEVDVDLNLDTYLARRGEVRQVFRENGLALSGVIGVVQQAFSTDRTRADQTAERFARLCDLAEELDCDTVGICAYVPDEIQKIAGTELYPGSPPLGLRLPPGFEWQVFWENAVSRFRNMCRIAAQHGQRLVIENRVGDWVSTSDGVLRLIEEAGEPNGGALLDLAHTNASKEPLGLVIEKLKPRLMYVHLADNDGTAQYHWPAGRGNIDFPEVFRSLRNAGYDGFANVDFGGVPPDQIWTETGRGREYFEACLAQIAEPSPS